jgi:hypothetical protein
MQASILSFPYRGSLRLWRALPWTAGGTFLRGFRVGLRLSPCLPALSSQANLMCQRPPLLRVGGGGHRVVGFQLVAITVLFRREAVASKTLIRMLERLLTSRDMLTPSWVAQHLMEDHVAG